MNCRELAELLIDYITGELPAEHQRLVQEHLGECPPCVVFMETYRVTIKITGQLPCRPLPQSLKERLEKALAEIRNDPGAEGSCR
jgi:anti-sigma factor RsiW